MAKALKTGNGNQPYLVYFEGEPQDITCAKTPAEAIGNVHYRLFRKHSDAPEPAKFSAAVLTDELYRKVKKQLEQNRRQKSKMPWQPLLDGKPFGNYLTMAVSEKRAACNRWFTRIKSKEHPASDQTKEIYHEHMSARPVFGKPAEGRLACHRRKVSHRVQLSLISDHH